MSSNDRLYVPFNAVTLVDTPSTSPPAEIVKFEVCWPKLYGGPVAAARGGSAARGGRRGGTSGRRVRMDHMILL